MPPLTATDRARITQAVTTAETATDGEIVPIIAARSDSYADVVLHWALLAMLATIAVAAAWPGWLDAVHVAMTGGWSSGVAPRLRILLFAVVLIFLLVTFAIGRSPLRYRLTPGATTARRVRRRAVDLFRVGVQTHTASRNGVLLYLSIAERRAEIVADAAVHARVPAELWGDVLADLLAQVRAGRTADGMVAAIAAIGTVLAAHFPRSGGDAPELPDRLIQL
ncbi:TPM domain-containing protein [Sphingomonas montana]|uniref:TPM domain-containing protein n=1 Tax=Sphingomonas montana TaxID=1843236 RepID=UPI00096FFBB8|nr:TPM domain-containing protein [Sphingomonas montana]